MRTRPRRWQIILTGALFAFSVGAARTFSANAGVDEQKALFRQGAALWPETCGNCHKPRPGGERSAGEWDVIMLHMRTVANLSRDDARAIQTYLRTQ